MPHSLADVTCNDPERLLRRLCNHWRHKFEIERRNEQHVLIPMGEIGTTEFTMIPGVLQIKAQPADGEAGLRLREVIAKHLQRFAQEETLVFDWRDG